MARTATTVDVFAAIGEPKRRKVMEILARGECAVEGLGVQLGWPQPMVSKHLKVLKEVGLVEVRAEGKSRVYRINGGALQEVYTWAGMFEKFWSTHVDRIKRAAEKKARERGVS